MKEVKYDIKYLCKDADQLMRMGDFDCALGKSAKICLEYPDQPQGYHRGARAAMELGLFALAEQFILSGIEKVADAIELYVAYAEAAIRTRRYAEGDARWQAVREKFPHMPQGYARGAAACLDQMQFEEAEKLCLEGMKIAPKYADCWNMYAECMMRQRRFPEALERWETAREKFPKIPAPYARAACACLEMNWYGDAEEFCKKGMQNASGWSDCWNMHAEIALKKRQYEEALERFNTCKERFPTQPEAYRRSVYILLDTYKFEKAESLCRRGLEASPYRIDLWACHMDVALRMRQYEAARIRAQEMRSRFPRHSLSYSKEAYLEMDLGRLDEAESICALGMRIAPYSLDSYIAWAEIAMRRGDYPEAASRWDTIRIMAEFHPIGYAKGARNASLEDKLEEAEEIARLGISKTPYSIDSWIQLAEIAMRKRDFQSARQRWRDIRERFPHAAIGYTRGAANEIELGYFGKANRLCTDGKANAPYSPESWKMSIEIAARREDHDEVIERCKLCRTRFALVPSGYTCAARAYASRGEFADANALLAQAEDLMPGNFELLTACGDIADKAEDREQALLYWERARRDFPLWQPGYVNAANILMAESKIAEAKSLYTRAMKRLSQYFSPIKISLYFLAYKLHMLEGNDVKNIGEYIFNLGKKFPWLVQNNTYAIWMRDYALKLIYRDKEEGIDIASDEIILFAFYMIQVNRFFLAKGAFWTFRDSFLKILPENKYFECWDKAQILYNTNSDLVRLLSPKYNKHDLKSILKLFIIKCNSNLARLQIFRKDLRSIYKEIISEMVSDGSYHTLDPRSIYNFIRIVNLNNQEQTNNLISALSGDEGGALDTPVGILKYRLHKSLLLHRKQRALPVPGKRLKVAVCISGQLRGYKKCLAPLVKCFGLNDHDTKLFLNSWRRIGRKFPVLAHAARTFSGNFLSAYKYVMISKNPKRYISEAYPSLYSLLDTAETATESELIKFYDSTNVVLEDDTQGKYRYYTNLQKLNSKLEKCIAMTGEDYYDIIIWCRADLKCISSSVVDLQEIYRNSKEDNILFTKGNYFVFNAHGEDYGIWDWIAIGTQPIMRNFSHIHSQRKFFIKQYAYGLPVWEQDHMAPGYHAFVNGINIKGLDGVRFSLEDPDKLDVKLIYEALKKDIAKRVATQDDKLLLEACEKDLTHAKVAN